MVVQHDRRRPLIALGVVCIVAGLATAAVLWIAATDRRSNAIAAFARAPVGCDTTLDFVEPGEYVLFVESAGRLSDVRGDCDVTGEFDVGVGPPNAQIALIDPDGESVELEPVESSGLAYDDGGYVGTAAFRVDIADTSDHVIRVDSADQATFAVAVGRDPSDGVAALRVGGLAAAAVGLGIGLAALIAGTRRRSSAPSVPAPGTGSEWQTGPYTPGRPPSGPPVYGRPDGPPPYGGPTRADAGAPAPPPPRADLAQQWGPPSTPPPQPSAPSAGSPRIPGQPDLGPARRPPFERDDVATDGSSEIRNDEHEGPPEFDRSDDQDRFPPPD